MHGYRCISRRDVAAGHRTKSAQQPVGCLQWSQRRRFETTPLRRGAQRAICLQKHAQRLLHSTAQVAVVSEGGVAAPVDGAAAMSFFGKQQQKQQRQQRQQQQQHVTANQHQTSGRVPTARCMPHCVLQQGVQQGGSSSAAVQHGAPPQSHHSCAAPQQHSSPGAQARDCSSSSSSGSSSSSAWCRQRCSQGRDRSSSST